MRLDFLFSLKSEYFIRELKYHRRDFLSYEVANELDSEAKQLINKKSLQNPLMLYLIAQVQTHLSNEIHSPDLKPDSNELIVRISFKKQLELLYLQNYLKLSGYEIDIEKPGSILFKIDPEKTTFKKITLFVTQLQRELNKNSINMPALLDHGVFADESDVQCKISPDTQVEATLKAKL